MFGRCSLSAACPRPIVVTALLVLMCCLQSQTARDERHVPVPQTIQFAQYLFPDCHKHEVHSRQKAHVSSQHVCVYACVNEVSTMWKQQKTKRRTNVTSLFSKITQSIPSKFPRPDRNGGSEVQTPARRTWPPLNECSSERQI